MCCVHSRSVVSNSFVTPWTVARQAPLSVRILQAGILEWVAMLSSRGSSQPRDRTQVSHTAGRFFTIWATRKPYNIQIVLLYNAYYASFCIDFRVLIFK